MKKLLLSVIFIFPLFISVKDILTGSIPFWFDPARDLLLALGNLHKPTLLGPPTGIPGIFYGPYWIWLLSVILIIFKDPRAVVFFTQTLPYFTLFPYLLWRLTKPYGSTVFLVVWFFFIFAYKNYTTYLWNPHLAPLFLLVIIFLLSVAFGLRRGKKLFFSLGLTGLVAGLLANFHMAFGVGVILALLLFTLSITYFQKHTILRLFKSLFFVALGIIIAFLPTIAFEFRHGFGQTKQIKETVLQAVSGTSDISLEGFSSTQIIEYFLTTPERLLLIPRNFLPFVYLIGFFAVFYLIKQKNLKLSKVEKRILVFLVLVSVSVLAIFLSASNPVWHYHFIGIEVIFLLALGLLIGKLKALRIIFSVWISVLFLTNVASFSRSFQDNPLEIPSLVSKQTIVESIYEDAGGKSFTVFAYDPAIYTYDFDYLFKWIAQRKGVEEPRIETSTDLPTYLIIPPAEQAIELDFINYKTPNDEYETIKQWKSPDDTLTVKRQRM